MIGVSAIINPNPVTVDTYSATELDYYANFYYDAYVGGYLYQKQGLLWVLIRSGSALSGSSQNIAYGYMHAPVVIPSSYKLESDHYVVAYYTYYDPDYGYSYYNPAGFNFGSTGNSNPSGFQFLPNSGPLYVQSSYIYIGTTGVGYAARPPAIEGIIPSGAVRGSSGYIEIYGQYMLGTTQAQISGGNPSVTPVYVSYSQVNLYYTLASNATTGQQTLTLTNMFGISNQQAFTVGDPTPTITAISPAAWESGTTKEFVIDEIGFGINPLLQISGTGITYTIASNTDTQIRANFTIAPNALS